MQFKELSGNPKFEGYLKYINSEYKRLSGNAMPELTSELFDLFYETGSRKEYESVYFERRRVLLMSALMCLIYDDSEYISSLENAINSICDEPVWALPAHINKDESNPQWVIDLFSAETGQTLSEIYELLGDRLSAAVLKRIDAELAKRIAGPFDKTEFNWEHFEHNWSAVCGGSVGMTLIYRFPDVFRRNEKRIVDIMNTYLRGFGDDGISCEGLGYWNYGFWYFTAFADLYKSRYGVDIMVGKKIKNIAMCQQNLMLGKNVVISFSDCSRTSEYNYALAHYYNDAFGVEIEIPDSGFSYGIDHCARFAPAIRSVLWYKSDIKASPAESRRELYFEDCGHYVSKSDRLSFAAKAGHNNESHNHNDVGSFIIASEDTQLLADYGACEYTRDYFNNSMRYSYLNAASGGHSVPLIDGQEQMYGQNHFGVVTEHKSGVFELEMSKTYDIKALKSLVRRFEIKDNTVELRDSFTFSDGKKHLITERFVSLIKPQIKGKKAIINGLVLECGLEPIVTAETVKRHADGADENIYLIDYSASEEFVITMRF